MMVLRINDSGFVWDVPAEAIAKNRATYYADNDKDTSYDEEFAFTMGSKFELRDWFFNNMDWDDVKDVAKLVKTPDLSAPRLSADGLIATFAEEP